MPPDLESQRSQLLSLWSKARQAARSDQPLLLLVDGLDEQARGEVTIADLLPGELGPYVHVVVTSRPNPEPLDQVPVGHPLRQAEVLRLYSLQHADIEQLLRSQGGTTAELRLAGRVLGVTKGEPLLARFISHDVASGGERVLTALEQNPPSGVKECFRQQFEQLDAQTEGDNTAWDVLGMLLIAHAAMALEELATLLEVPVRQVRRAIAPIQRFLVGRERVELMHLELRAVVAEQFSEAERQANRRRLLAWCASFSGQGWPADTPGYVLGSYASHLHECRDYDALYRLIACRLR